MVRERKTPQQRAQENVDLLNRRLKRIASAKIKVAAQLVDLQDQHDTVAERLKYALANPDLTPSEPVP